MRQMHQEDEQRRGVLSSVLRTFAFHVLSFAFGCVLLLLLVLTAGFIGLFLLCLVSQSSASSRVLVAYLWHAEQRINELAKAAAEQWHNGQPIPGSRRPSLPPYLEQQVTSFVMIFSLLYFLLFRGLFDIIFSAIPLMLYALSTAQVVQLGDSVFQIADTTSGRIFTTVALAFLAHQIGVSAAYFSVALSDRVAIYLFECDRNEALVRSFYPPLSDASYQPRPYEYGTHAYRVQQSSGNDRPEQVPMAVPHYGDRPQRPRGWHSFEEREVEICGFKVSVKTNRRTGSSRDPDHETQEFDRPPSAPPMQESFQPLMAPMDRIPQAQKSSMKRASSVESFVDASGAAKVSHSAHKSIHEALDLDSYVHDRPSGSRATTRSYSTSDLPIRQSYLEMQKLQKLLNEWKSSKDKAIAPELLTDETVESTRGEMDVASDIKPPVIHETQEPDEQAERKRQQSTKAQAIPQEDSGNELFSDSRSVDSIAISPSQQSVSTDAHYRTTYQVLTPPASPRASSDHEYTPLSPTPSLQESEPEFPSEQLHQVYRSIRYTGPTSLAPGREVELLDVPGQRDRVHFNSFAPPYVTPSRKPFSFSVWAFLLNQKAEMEELASENDPEGRVLPTETKMDLRRGALVHVTLEPPEGFNVVNAATQGFEWQGKLSHVSFDVECTDDAPFGQVLFKARIVVGSHVALLRAYLCVVESAVDAQPTVVSSELEVMEMTYNEIAYEDLELQELVGQGFFGDAYRATYKGQQVVVKTLRAAELGDSMDQVQKEFQHEAAALSMFGHHPCIVSLVGASTDTRYPLALVTEFVEGGNLEENLKHKSSAFSTTSKTTMMREAAAGFLNIHEGGFIHRDIAARNCLLSQDQHIKICDFGLCRRVHANIGAVGKDAFGPVKYMAPESLQPPHHFSFSSDAYMFGVLMWETYTSSPPFASVTASEAVQRVLRGERLEVPSSLPSSVQSLMKACFHDCPVQRPSMQSIVTALDVSLQSSVETQQAQQEADVALRASGIRVV